MGGAVPASLRLLLRSQAGNPAGTSIYLIA